MHYTKLFSSLVASSVWREDDKTRLVWITMLAMRNQRNEVDASLPGLADLARVSVEECEEALRKLSAPDKWSRNKANEGRRIEECAGGWRILNAEHYRRLLSKEEKAEYMREYMRGYRKVKEGAREKAEVAGRTRAVKEVLDEANEGL